MSGDLAGLTPQEQALLGCWQGLQGTTAIHYRFHTDRAIDSILPDGRSLEGTFTAATNMMHLDFGKPVSHRVFVTTDSITYVDLPGELTRQTCD